MSVSLHFLVSLFSALSVNVGAIFPAFIFIFLMCLIWKEGQITLTTFEFLVHTTCFLNFLHFSFCLTSELELQPDDSELPDYFKMPSSSAVEMVRSAKDFLPHTQKRGEGVPSVENSLRWEIFEMNSLYPRGINTSGELFGISWIGKFSKYTIKIMSHYFH